MLKINLLSNHRLDFFPSRSQSNALHLLKEFCFETNILRDFFQKSDSLKKIPKCANNIDSSQFSNAFFLTFICSSLSVKTSIGTSVIAEMMLFENLFVFFYLGTLAVRNFLNFLILFHLGIQNHKFPLQHSLNRTKNLDSKSERSSSPRRNFESSKMPNYCS